MRTLKTNGLAEADRLLRRVRSALALGRIYPADAEYVETRLDEIKARIVGMHELNEIGEEEG